jgi:hypothetical protein
LVLSQQSGRVILFSAPQIAEFLLLSALQNALKQRLNDQRTA